MCVALGTDSRSRYGGSRQGLSEVREEPSMEVEGRCPSLAGRTSLSYLTLCIQTTARRLLSSSLLVRVLQNISETETCEYLNGPNNPWRRFASGRLPRQLRPHWLTLTKPRTRTARVPV